tara:strand:+ start:1665 stop:1907 length:243 start_codon:yes stop_codon:yes gene_type:complete
MNFSIILGIACLGAVLQELPIWNTILEKTKLDRKPFNCALCFTFWCALPYLAFTGSDHIIFNSIIAAVLADLINRQMNRA